MLFSVEQAFVGRDEIRAPLKTRAWEATAQRDSFLLSQQSQSVINLSYRWSVYVILIQALSKRININATCFGRRVQKSIRNTRAHVWFTKSKVWEKFLWIHRHCVQQRTDIIGSSWKGEFRVSTDLLRFYLQIETVYNYPLKGRWIVVVYARCSPTLRGIVVLVFTKSVG